MSRKSILAAATCLTLRSCDLSSVIVYCNVSAKNMRRVDALDGYFLNWTMSSFNPCYDLEVVRSL